MTQSQTPVPPSILVDVGPAAHQRAGLSRYAAELAGALLEHNAGDMQLAFFYNRHSGHTLPPRLQNSPQVSLPLGQYTWRLGALASQTLGMELLPVRRAAGSSRLVSPRPDISKALAPVIVEDARAAVGLLVAAPAEARRLGADPGLAKHVLDEASQKARTYANDLVAEIRAAEGGERAAAKHLLEQTLSVVGPLLNPDEVGLVRDRAAAAAVTV